MVYIIHVRSMQHHKCGRPLEIMYLNMLYITVAPGVGLGLMILCAPWPGPNIPLISGTRWPGQWRLLLLGGNFLSTYLLTLAADPGHTAIRSVNHSDTCTHRGVHIQSLDAPKPFQCMSNSVLLFIKSSLANTSMICSILLAPFALRIHT